ncbi:MAG: glucans biosynthesis glucosyltransferase MdoH [Hyphomicrobiales bacterium]|nr:glucans biosynthesis glucosyltransferase MdoH [Hyphomicrobiales bacterium]OQW82078.1 MAG: glucan biosynthesis glucosyltransferase H [Proteobacteria bacterium ST_bin15]
MNLRPDPSPFANSPVAAIPSSVSRELSDLNRRRSLMLTLNVVTWLAMNAVAIRVLGADGFSLATVLVLLAFAVATPWTVLGFWNAVVGLWLLHGVDNGKERVAPYAASGDGYERLSIRTAILMTLRNEDPSRAIARLKTVRASLDATSEGRAFDYFLLSDTSDPGVAMAEEQGVAAWQAELGPDHRIVYRRRADNAGFKAGNVRDFCERWGANYELMLPLDADSLMAGPTVVRHVRMMQASPRLGILQSLVVGMPSRSFFARIFQFGMRHGMRSYTMGQAWWTGECGPFWGHNALVRIKPFTESCHLPVLPGGPPLGGPVMSHDQVEATLMRRAGYEVRVLPEEQGSWEENPPTIFEFSRRDLRWCLGNLQYLRLLDLPGLKPMSRFQLVWAILMFIGVPAWTLIIALSPVLAFERAGSAVFPAGLAIGLHLTFFTMYLMPKLAGLADIALTKGGTMRYGGTGNFALSALTEIVFSFLLGAVTTFRITLFMLSLLVSRDKPAWGGQSRDAHRLTWGEAAKALWPQTLFGIVILGALFAIHPTVALWSLPLTLGFLTAVPFAVLTSLPELGAWSKRIGLCGIPEDFATPAEIAKFV